MLEFTAHIVNGSILPPDHIVTFLRRCQKTQARISLSWTLKKRSSKQNAFYFGPVIKAFREWFLENGYNFSAKDIHEFIVSRVWKHTEVAFIDDMPFERRLSSTKLSSSDWENKIELARVWAAEHAFFIPLPNEEKLNYQPNQ